MKFSFTTKTLAVLTLILTWIVQITAPNTFCSAYCQANQCTGVTASDCKGCLTGFTLAGGVCSIDPTTGWSMIAQQTDGSLTVNNTQSAPACGPYNNYYGNFAWNDVITATVAAGVPYPHFSIRFVFWFVFLDQWDNNDQVQVDYNGTIISRKKSNKNTSENVCNVGVNNNMEDYLQISPIINHSQLDVQLDFTISIKLFNTGNLNKKFWGVKEFYLLAKLCHPACSACFGSLVSQCTACFDDLPYYLSNTTCNETCLDGYGYTDYSNVCVYCDLKCQVCYNQSTNCTVCTPSGIYEAFWVQADLACVKPCPAGYYGNYTDHVCYPCLTQCATCRFNQSYCLSCITDYGWNDFTCYQPCPVGTYNNSNLINCTNCSPYCISCDINSTYCFNCTLSGTYQAYLLNNQCFTNCPAQYYPFNNSALGPNTCQPCDISCYLCTDNPTPCSQCNPNYFLFQSACGDADSCPQPDYFADIVTWQCKLCSQFCVQLTIDMYFSNSLHRKLYIDMNFTQDIDFTTFDMEGFQTISFESTFYDVAMFNFQYVVTSTSSYRIIMQPKGYIFLYNQTVTVKTMAKPDPVHTAINSRPFSPTNYQLSDSQVWFVIQAPDLSQTEQEIIDQMSKASDKISSVLTLPYVQQITKSGAFMFLFPGAQITSCSILFNTIPAQNHYQGVRFWGNFIFFDVPNWQANSDKTKYLVVPPVNQVIKDARLLFNIETLGWRFQRTGHTSFFFFDTYIQISLVVFCWILLGITFLVEKYFYQKLKNHMGKIYTFVHKVHELSLMYIGINAMLQWVYFDSTSVERWISFSISLFMVLYFLLYQLYVYYDMLAYPVAAVGNKRYDFYATRYGCILRDIRFEQYDMKQPWSPKVWFRPYNYHLLSFYKKILMMVSLPMFYETPYAQVSVLIALQVMEIARFIATRPYAYLWRNIVRFLLELMLLLFFISCLIQSILIQRIMYNDPQTLQNDITVYYRFGWVGFVSCFIFNSSFVLLAIYDIIRGCRSTNRQLMDEARRGFYYDKLKQYEQKNEDVPLGLVNKWVRLGNLNKRQYEELPDINLRVECYRFSKNKSGSQSNTFQVQMKNIIEIFMNVQFNFHKENNVTVGKKMNKTFTLTRSISPSIYNMLDDLWKKYASYQVQTLILKTFQKVQQNKYKPGDKIQLAPSIMTQVIEMETFSGEKKIVNLPKKLEGFPIPPGDLQILESVLNG